VKIDRSPFTHTGRVSLEVYRLVRPGLDDSGVIFGIAARL
jgi:hypothetical protein